MLSLAVGICDLDQRKKWNDSRDSRQDGCCSPGAPFDRSENPAGPLGGRRKPRRGLGVVCPTRSGHFEKSTLKKQHKKALRLSRVRPFVLYSLRHTFLTRLGESGCDVWTLARIAGHSSVAMSARYVHPSEDAVLAALDRLSGHNFGHTANSSEKRLAVEPLLSSSNDLSKDGRGERI
jgi:hypothetical protein